MEKHGLTEITPTETPLAEKTFESDILTPSGLTGYEIEERTNGRFYGLGKYFALAEKETGVNALFLVAIAALESGWGTSYAATRRNNLFGWANGRHVFESQEAGILHVAEFLKVNYLTAGGRFFRGYEIEDVAHFYATDPAWASKVRTIFNQLQK